MTGRAFANLGLRREDSAKRMNGSESVKRAVGDRSIYQGARETIRGGVEQYV